MGNTKSTAATTTTISPTTTLQNNSGGTVAPGAPTVDAVTPGEASVKVGGVATAARVQRSNNQLVVTAGPLTATLGALDRTGRVAALDPDGNVRLNPGDPVRINVAGFKPGTSVQVWLFSTPVLLGVAKVSDAGTVTASFTVPKDAPSGSHRIAVVATTMEGKPATLTVGVKVGSWKKESSMVVWLIVLPILLAVAGALALPATRRRRKTAG